MWLKLLARLDEPVQNAHRQKLGHMGRERLRTLAELLSLAPPGQNSLLGSEEPDQ